MNDDKWVKDGRCRGLDPDMFFPEHGRSDLARAAKQVCAECPVKAECLDYAQRTGPVEGIWGGTTAKERRYMRAGGTGGPSVDHARYRKVAEVAVNAHKAGLVPTKAVADALNITPESARHAVRRARQLGHDIPPLYNGGDGSRVRQ